MAKKQQTQVIVKYTTDDKYEQSFENMYYDIPKYINTDVSFQLMFGYEYNHIEERRLELKHQRNNMQIEIDETSIFNS
jgi:hypothetical protein